MYVGQMPQTAPGRKSGNGREPSIAEWKGEEGRRRGVNPIFSNNRGKSEKHLMQQACSRVQFMAIKNIVILGGFTYI